VFSGFATRSPTQIANLPSIILRKLWECPIWVVIHVSLLCSYSIVYYRLVNTQSPQKNICHFGRSAARPVILADTLIVLRISTRHYIYSTLFLRKLSAELYCVTNIGYDLIMEGSTPNESEFRW
jgi:hypothetical protein